MRTLWPWTRSTISNNMNQDILYKFIYRRPLRMETISAEYVATFKALVVNYKWSRPQKSLGMYHHHLPFFLNNLHSLVIFTCLWPWMFIYENTYKKRWKSASHILSLHGPIYAKGPTGLGSKDIPCISINISTNTHVLC